MGASAEMRRYRRVAGQESSGSGIMSRWTLLLLIVLAAGLGYVRLRSSAERQHRQLQVMRREFSVRVKEVQNLQVEYEMYRSGQYVLSAVSRLGLELHPPLPGQVRRVSLPAQLGSGQAQSAEGSLVVRN